MMGVNGDERIIVFISYILSLLYRKLYFFVVVANVVMCYHIVLDNRGRSQIIVTYHRASPALVFFIILLSLRENQEQYELKDSRCSSLFNDWSNTTQDGLNKKIAITASPGYGKTILLSMFANWLRNDWLQEQLNKGEKIEFVPIVLFLTAASIPEEFTKKDDFTVDNLWDLILNIADSASPEFPNLQIKLSETLKEIPKKHLIYLLFDGLDEFGSARRGSLGRFMQVLTDLAEKRNVNILLTCRKVFWRNDVANEIKNIEEQWSVFSISPIIGKYTKDYKEIFDELFAFPDKKLIPGLSNPLIVSFIQELDQDGDLIPELKYKSRSGLFKHWVKYIAKKVKDEVINWRDWMKIFEETAFLLLKNEQASISAKEIPKDRDISSEEFYKLCCKTRILKPSGDIKKAEVKFLHEFVKEFFVACKLAKNFEKILENYQNNVHYPLADVNLDFLQPSISGFLHEQLTDDYLSKLIKFFKESITKYLDSAETIDPDRMLLRNLIEYIGKTYKKTYNIKNAEYEDLIKLLLSLIGNPNLDSKNKKDGDDHDKIRYNVARVLERIHPLAPQPFYDYMSDWGDRDWSNERKRAGKLNINPIAIRWHGIGDAQSPRKRQPGEGPPLAFCIDRKTDFKIYLKLQKEVSKKLIDIINDLLKNPERNDWLIINCTFALVRWFHKDHLKCLKDLRRKAEKLNATEDVRKNLNDWVGKKEILDILWK